MVLQQTVYWSPCRIYHNNFCDIVPNLIVFFGVLQLFKKMSSIDGSSSSNSSSNSESKSPPNELAMETAFFTEINRLCIKKGVHVNSSFVSGVKSVFGAKTDQLDFSGMSVANNEFIRIYLIFQSWIFKEAYFNVKTILNFIMLVCCLYRYLWRLNFTDISISNDSSWSRLWCRTQV